VITAVDPVTGSYPSSQPPTESCTDGLIQRQFDGVLDPRGAERALSLSKLMFVDFK
jgi:hypothetical protein